MKRATLRALSSCTRALNDRRDFFGIADITSKDIAAAFANESKLSSRNVSSKYEPLIKARGRLANEENDEDVVFGRVRYDKDNVPKVHGQFEPTSTRRSYDTVGIKQLFVPDSAAEGDTKREVVDKTEIAQEANVGAAPYRISDVQPVKDIGEILQDFGNPSASELLEKYSNQPPLTFYFEESALLLQDSTKPKQIPKFKLERMSKVNIQIQEQQIEAETRSQTAETICRQREERIQLHKHLDLELDGDAIQSEEGPLQTTDEFDFDRSVERKYDVKPVTPTKAIDYMKKVRKNVIEPASKVLRKRLETSNRPYPLKSTIKLDSQGYRDYSTQIPNWRLVRHADILTHIKSSIIYNNYDILAINKSYGIASHEENKAREHVDMNSLVQEIAESMHIKKVYLAHRLDKSTTGVLLFATSQEMANKLNKLFRADEIKKTYWAITKGIPKCHAAVIDLPIGEFKVADKMRSCPVPEFFDEGKQLAMHFREARRAITEYHVLNHNKFSALVELKPQSGVKHQIRCHLGFGLNTPILGDHKYSNLGKIAPQKLPLTMLKLLNLRQEKVRTLPIHLHAKRVVIPGVKANGETLFIDAPLPPHFVENLKSLKLQGGLVKQMSF